MKKSLIEVNYEKLTEDSAIVFRKNKWIAVSRTVFLDDIHKSILSVDEKINAEIAKKDAEIAALHSEIEELRASIAYILGEDEEEAVENEE